MDNMDKADKNLVIAKVNHSRHGDSPLLIYKTLRNQIFSGGLKAGDQIRQQRLANEFGVSSIPVREALRMIEADGLIEFIPRKGAVVRNITFREIMEIADIRLTIEPLMLSWSIPNLTEGILEEAKSNIELYKEANDPWEQIKLNRDFHLLLYEKADSRRLYEIIDSLFNGILLFGVWKVVTLVDKDSAIEEHNKIIEACERMDVESANKVLREHLSHAKMRLNKYKEIRSQKK
jgi:DNA-binding GntR family transcriptional regulator